MMRQDCTVTARLDRHPRLDGAGRKPVAITARVIGTACIAGACLAGMPAQSEEAHVVIGPEQVWIEYVDPIEIMWVGPNAYERTQVLSGDNIELVAFATEEGSAALLGARAIVASKTGTHSCETGDPLDYYVVTLTPGLATEGPATTCGRLEVVVTNGAIVAEDDPMQANAEDGGQFWAWVPGRGFVDRLD